MSTISFSPLNNPGGILTFQTRIRRLLAASKETRSWAGNELVSGAWIDRRVSKACVWTGGGWPQSLLFPPVFARPRQ